MPKLIERPVGIPREDVEKAPPLVSRKFFLDASGLTVDDFYLMVQDGEIKGLVVGVTKSRRRYYKADLMRICGYVRNGG